MSYNGYKVNFDLTYFNSGTIQLLHKSYESYSNAIVSGFSIAVRPWIDAGGFAGLSITDYITRIMGIIINAEDT